MKALLAIAGPFLLFVFSFLMMRGSYQRGKAAGLNAKRQELGISRTSAENYRRAMITLNKMINIDDLDGPWAQTILANPARAEINQILAIYRKENGL